MHISLHSCQWYGVSQRLIFNHSPLAWCWEPWKKNITKTQGSCYRKKLGHWRHKMRIKTRTKPIICGALYKFTINICPHSNYFIRIPSSMGLDLLVPQNWLLLSRLKANELMSAFHRDSDPFSESEWILFQYSFGRCTSMMLIYHWPHPPMAGIWNWNLKRLLWKTLFMSFLMSTASLNHIRIFLCEFALEQRPQWEVVYISLSVS